MNSKKSLTIDVISENTTEETPIITLIPCEYGSSEEEDYSNSSQYSIESSELGDDSDNETQLITQFCTVNKILDKIDEKKVEKNSKINKS